MEAVVDTRRYGDRSDVFSGRALMTKGGLKKEDLFEKNGKYVSKKMSENAKSRNNFGKKVQAEPQKKVEEIVDAFEKLIADSPSPLMLPVSSEPQEPKPKKKRVRLVSVKND
jgi:hypothetical protein